MSITPEFGGPTFNPARDAAALNRQLDEVRSIMLSGGWHTLAEISATVSERIGRTATEASVSARLRDLRKPQHGAYNIERRIRGGAGRLWEYHLGPNTAPLPAFAHGKTRSESA